MTITDQATDGRMESGAAVWDAAVRTALQLLATRPLHEITLEQVAAHIGVPTATVLEQVPDLNQLLIAAIQHWHGERMTAVQVNATRDGTSPSSATCSRSASPTPPAPAWS